MLPDVGHTVPLMEQPTRGRHRRAPVRQRLPLTVATVGAVVLVAATVTVTTAVTGNHADRPPATAGDVTTTSPGSATANGAPADLAATRDVAVRRDVVTVVETVTVMGGEGVVVAPATGSGEPALDLIRVQLLAEDGTQAPLADPVSLGAGRSITVQGSYRLRSCPDLLPSAWPSPVSIRGSAWSRSYTRTSEPLRTGPTLCPGRQSQADVLAGLSARIGDGEAGGRPPSVRVRLRWQGPGRLAVDGVGALSDLAALPVVVRGGPGHCPDQGCIGTPGPAGLALDVQPVEACPNQAPRPDRLTLLVRVAGGQPRLVVVEVPGLGHWLGRTVCR